MKINLLIIIPALLFAGCYQSAKPINKENISNKLPANKGSKISRSGLLTLLDAEKILGEKGSLTDSSTTHGKDAVNFACSYKAISEDKKTGKTGTLYFLLEEYNLVSGAEKRYKFIKEANSNNAGIKTLDGLGDEAYFHSDKENFYFVMVRKGNKVFNLKVNKITSFTSLNVFNTVTKKITEAL